MKILFVTGFDLTHIGGGETWLLNVANRMKLRHDVKILMSSLGKRSNLTLEGISLRHYEPVSLFNGFLASKLQRTGFTIPSPTNFKAFRTLFDDSDVVYSIYFWDLQLACLPMQYLSGTPVILGHHTALDRLKFDQSLFARLAYKFLVPSNTRMSMVFAGHHVLNRREFETLLRHGAKNVFNIPNGVETSVYQTSTKFDTFTLIFVGRLVHQKGVDLLPQIAGMLDEQLNDYKLNIIGDGDLRALVKSMQSDRIAWLGPLQESKKNELLSKSHLLIAPSRHEAFPITGIEAMAAGTPVVSFDIPGPREFIIDGYNGFLAKCPYEMTEKILKLYKMYKNGRYWNLVDNAKATAKRFDWSAVIPQIESMMERVSKAV